MPSRRNHSSARWRHFARADGQGGQNQNQFCGYPSRPRNPPGLWLSTHPAPGRALASPHGAVLAPATAMRGAAKVIEIRVSDIALVGKRRHSCRRFFVSRLQIPALTFIALLDALVNPLDSLVVARLSAFPILHEIFGNLAFLPIMNTGSIALGAFEGVHNFFARFYAGAPSVQPYFYIFDIRFKALLPELDFF
jgi:hypothetical protein